MGMLLKPRLTAEGLPLRTLLEGAPAEVRDWFRSRTELADGRGARFSVYLASPKTLRQEIASATGHAMTAHMTSETRDLRAMTAGLLVSGAGMTLEQTATLLGASYSSVREWTGRHRALLKADAEYALTCARVLQAAARREFGSEDLLIGV